MFRPVLTLAAVGAVGIIAWQLLWALVLPLVFGIFAVVIKVVFWVTLIALGVWVIKRLTRTSESPA